MKKKGITIIGGLFDNYIIDRMRTANGCSCGS